MKVCHIYLFLAAMASAAAPAAEQELIAAARDGSSGERLSALLGSVPPARRGSALGAALFEASAEGHDAAVSALLAKKMEIPKEAFEKC